MNEAALRYVEGGLSAWWVLLAPAAALLVLVIAVRWVPVTKRLCARCGDKPAKHRRKYHGGRMGRDKDHDLCPQCAGELSDQARARVRAEREKGPTEALEELSLAALLARVRAYLDPEPVFLTEGDHDAWWKRRVEERDRLIGALDRYLAEGGQA